MNPHDNANDASGKDKDVTIIVNGRPKVVPKGEISFETVVLLAFSTPHTGPDYEYTVTYAKGHDSKKEGALTAGNSVRVKDGMIFNVTETNKS